VKEDGEGIRRAGRSKGHGGRGGNGVREEGRDGGRMARGRVRQG